jgi:hypothetical protein
MARTKAFTGADLRGQFAEHLQAVFEVLEIRLTSMTGLMVAESIGVLRAEGRHFDNAVRF